MKTIKDGYKKIYSYLVTNKLFISYVIIMLVGCAWLRGITIENAFGFKATIAELGMILVFGSFAYLFKSKNQFIYLFILISFFALLFVINTIYYKFFTNFASAGDLATISQVETVTGSLFEKVRVIDFIYVLMPLSFILITNHLKTTSYFDYLAKIQKMVSVGLMTCFIGILFIALRFCFASNTDYSRIHKQWNRPSIVDRFGIILYHGNDLIQTLIPRFSSLFGFEDALKVFQNYYKNYPHQLQNNKYTGIFAGKNLILVHMESIQSFLMQQKFNGVELTPNLNQLGKEGLLFTNFYPQIATGTSSDTEFTLLTGLMPAASGPVFVSYFDREFVTIPKLLVAKGYRTFSMHGNAATMWNRSKAHPRLGYQDLYYKEYFTFDESDVINLGINDKLFFKQAIPLIENIERNNTNYMGTIITLSNHSPFQSLDKYGDFDLSQTIVHEDPITGEQIEEKVDYLTKTAIGNYFHSVHYADEALGDLISYIKESEYFNNTIFVFYGDHEAKISKTNMNYLYNYDPLTKKLKSETDPSYLNYDYIDYELDKKTPLIIWTKNKNLQKKLPSQIDEVMGMFDVAPTLGNLMGFDNPYALGHDIFNIRGKNTVVFPSGNFLTDDIYYSNSTGEYKIIKEGVVLDDSYLDKRIQYVDDCLEVSNSIIVYNLLSDEHLKEIENLEKTNEK